MKLAKQEVPSRPTIPSDEICRLRASLILEECLEFIEAIGCEVLVEGTFTLNKANHSIISVKDPDMVESLDAICDINVINTGSLLALGFSGDKLQKIVDDNNLEKFGEGHSWNNLGKLIKPKNFVGPTQKIKEYISHAENKQD